jgi:hypothetical protein
MTRKGSPVVMIAVFMIIIVIILFFAGGYASGFGLSATISDDLLAVFPGLFVSIISIIAISQTTDSPLIIGGFSAVGIGLAILLSEAYTAGIIVDAMLGGATIAQYETIMIILGLIMGTVAYVGRRG